MDRLRRPTRLLGIGEKFIARIGARLDYEYGYGRCGLFDTGPSPFLYIYRISWIDTPGDKTVNDKYIDTCIAMPDMFTRSNTNTLAPPICFYINFSFIMMSVCCSFVHDLAV